APGDIGADGGTGLGRVFDARQAAGVTWAAGVVFLGPVRRRLDHPLIPGRALVVGGADCRQRALPRERHHDLAPERVRDRDADAGANLRVRHPVPAHLLADILRVEAEPPPAI